MLSAENVMQLIQSLIWLLAGVGVFIVGMNFMSDALEKSAGDGMKRVFSAMHFSRLSEGHCSLEVSPYFTSAITGLERVADHIVNVGYSICNPTGDDNEHIS